MTHRVRLFATAMAVLALPGLACAAAPQFAHVFTDHAVLQRGAAIHVWGTATPNLPVTVALNTGDTFTATADANGHWAGDLPPVHAGGPFRLTASDSEGTTALNDILIGDVYLCSGQSNMEFNLAYATNSWGMMAIPADDNLRYINVARDSSPAPLGELRHPAAWKATGPTTPDVSAVCYHMAQAIEKDQKVPVGMIDSYWGGTVIQAWISGPSLRTLPAYAQGVDALKNYAANPDKAQADWDVAMRDAWKTSEPDLATSQAWIASAFNDTAWKSMTPDGIWENSGVSDFANLDGVVWFRQTVTLTMAQAASVQRIELGPVDDADVTWINGVQVGTTYSYDMPRKYAIPAGTLKKGKNTIVVRVLDTGGGGGLWGHPSDRKLDMADGTSLPLPAAWKYRIAGPMKPSVTVVSAPWATPNGLNILYNAMIAPVAPYTLKGVAWYQGENNVNDAKGYQQLLPLMMKDWRQSFNNPALPFLIVQLANFGPVATVPGPSSWAELRNAQRLVVDGDPHAGLAVTVDIGDRTDIHPTQKTVVGNRLYRAAQAVIYGQDVTNGGPEATTVTRTGSDLVIHFKNSGGSLKTYSSNEAIAFEACTAPNSCTYVPGTVKGPDVVLTGANQPAINHIRYAWADGPYVNLYSADDLPAVPFEMDVPQ